MNAQIHHQGLTIQSLRELSEALFNGLGKHVLADFYECQNVPSSATELEQLMLDAAATIQATVVNSTFHEFSPHGLSGVVVIAESHLTAHTWPEHETICIDLFTCSPEMDTLPGLIHLFDRLQAGSMDLKVSDRGSRIS